MSNNVERTEYKKGFNLKATSCLMSLLLVLMVIASLLVERWNYYSKHFQQYLFLELIVVAVIAVLVLFSNKSETVRLDWFALFFWGGFTLYTLASDFLVNKTYRFSEMLLFITLFLLGYAWNRSADKGMLIHSFERAIQWFLFAFLIMSILFPVQSRVPNRYSGPIENPSVYALYLCSIWAVLLGSLDNRIKNKEFGARIIITIVEMMVALILMVMSQSLTPMIAMAAVTFLWLFRIIARHKGIQYAILLFVFIAFAMMFFLIGVVVFIRNSGAVGDSRLVQKLQSANISIFLSGRDYYWRRYLSEMNLLGHSKKPYLWDHRILPHNAIIGMMYWYGVPSAVPYIIMMIMAMEKSYRFADTGFSYASVPFYSIVSFVIMSMADNVEQPFVWLPWIACYLMMAPILLMPVEEIEALKSANADINTEEPEQV